MFSKDMCTIDPAQLKKPIYLEKVLYEFKIKMHALSVIKCFLNKCFVLLNSQLIKLLASFLSGATTFFLSQDKTEIPKLFKKVFADEYTIMKSDLFECLS